MIAVDVTSSDKSGITGMVSGLRKQMPFALSLALNKTANSAQDAVRASLRSHYVLRREPFDLQTIYRDPRQDFATKDRLVAAVRVNPARDFFAKFEDGGDKLPTRAANIAVPIFRLDDPMRVIGRGDPMSVRMLLNAIDQRMGRVLHATFRKGVARVRQVGNAVFLVKKPGGSLIKQRIGPHDVITLWKFIKRAPIPADLHFEDIALAAALASWEPNVEDAIAHAIETAR